MAYAFVGSGAYTNFGNPGGGSGTITYSATLGNTLIVVAYGQTTGPTLSDGHNTYTNLGQQAASGNSVFSNMWVAPVTTGGSLTITLAGTTNGMTVFEYSGLAASAYISGSFQSGVNASPGTGANAVTTTSQPNVTSVPAMLFGLTVDTQTMTSSGTNPAPILGTSLSYTSRAVGWLGTSSQQGALAEDVRITSPGSNPITFTSSSGAQFDTFVTIAAAFVEAAAAPIADGNSTANVLTIATGTNGAAMPAMAVGQLWDVLVLNQGTYGNTTVSDGSANVYQYIQTLDDGANGFTLNQFYCMVTVPLASPVITANKNAGLAQPMSIGAALNSAAGVISTTSPYTANTRSNSKQTTPSGTNAQTSGSTQVPPAGPGLTYTLGGWSFCANKTSASTAGTGYNLVGTAWSFLGGACLTYETQTNLTGGSAQAALFTPPGSTNTYTLAAVYNNIPLFVPSGPMPRQIYVMP